MSRRKSCKWRHGLFKSFKLLFCAEWICEEVCEGYIPFSKELVNVHLGVLQSHGKKILWTQTTGHKTHGFSVGNKKWFETSI